MASRFDWPAQIERIFVVALAVGFVVTLVPGGGNPAANDTWLRCDGARCPARPELPASQR